MGPRKPEIEYINLDQVAQCNQSTPGVEQAVKDLKKLADGALKKGPFSITHDKKPTQVAPSGDIHDFLSYAPYWWPSDKNDGTYIRKDGKRNPDVALVQDQTQLEQFAENLMYLCLGYQVYKNESYASHAVQLLHVFLVAPSTRMNPNVNYGQVIRGTNGGSGRPDGIISTRVLARVANVIPVLYNYEGYRSIAEPIAAWFQDYGHWLLTSDLGRQAAAYKNNHASWYMVQLVMVLGLGGNLPSPLLETLNTFINTALPQQIDMKTGDQPLESQRKLSFHYLAFNLQALIFIDQWLHHHTSQTIDRWIAKAVDFLVTYDTAKSNEDPTVAVRCVEIMNLQQNSKSYRRFTDMAKTCDTAEKISGPKYSIHALWSR